MSADFEPYLSRWNLTLDGDAFTSMNGVLVPVRRGDVPAMLNEAEEQVGSALMVWGGTATAQRPYSRTTAKPC